MKLLAALLSSFILFGCTSMGDYYKSVDSTNLRQVEATKAQSEAETARYIALARIAETGDTTARVAATMALALGGSSNRQGANLVSPVAPQNEALQWASILVPSVTQLGMGLYNKQVQINANNNNRAIQEANITKDLGLGLGYQQTYLGFAKEINDTKVVTNSVEKAVIVKPEVITSTNTSKDVVIVKPEVITNTIEKPLVVDTKVVYPGTVNPVIVNPTVVTRPCYVSVAGIGC